MIIYVYFTSIFLELEDCTGIIYTVLTSVGGDSGSEGRNGGSRGYIAT